MAKRPDTSLAGVERFVVASRAFELTQARRTLVYCALMALLVPLARALTSYGIVSQAVAVPAFVAVFAGVIIAGLTRARIEVSAEGISRRWLGRTTFVPLDEVREARPTEIDKDGRVFVGIAIVRRDGSSVPIMVGEKLSETGERDRILASIWREVAFRGRLAPETIDASLLRGTRDPSTWIRGLRAAGSGADADHRHAPVPAERLWALVDDARAEAPARAAAAIAVGTDASPEQRERIRVAARSTALPELRVALERAAEEEIDDEALAEVLMVLEKKERRS